MMKRAIATVGVASLALGLSACGGSDDESSSGSGDKVKIGIKFDQPGLGLKAGSDYKGLDVDVAKYVAKEMGYEADKIEFVETPSKQREKMLENGSVKMIFATYSITDKRKKVVSFGGPYFIAGQSVLVKSDSSIKSVSDLSGKKVCSVTGSTSVDNLKEKQPNLVPQKYDKYSECADALASGAIEAMTTDNTILAGYANQDAYKGKFKLVGDPFTEEKYGVGLKKGDKATCEKVNAAIKKMIDSGEWKKAVEANLGADFKYDTKVNPPKSFEACS
ncbi:glutamate ABC transporter substrate-binding protein [Dermacoccus abyssi]|uniref:glutamate ABC transporter substrate-binding protein n=1 Tax=Dermacoccus abyssi TaxID=322596 RepID=UPI003B8A6F85